jgi:hypothetical protein
MASQSFRADRQKHRLKRLYHQVLPRLLGKPPSKWTREELWSAVDLHFHKPFGGIFNLCTVYAALEEKLRRESGDTVKRHLRKGRGRPRRYSTEQYRKFFNDTQRIRKVLADERGVPISKVTDKDIARAIAETYCKKKGLTTQSEIRKMTVRYATFIKGVNKKKKSGEI